MIGKKKSQVNFDDQEDTTGEEANTQNAKFIFYNDKKFTKQIELYAILNSMSTTKVLVVVDKTASIDFLCVKIAEAYDQYPEFKNLEGLKATDLSKRNDQGNEIIIPNSGYLQDFIINGDIIYCDLLTNEFWIKATISMSKGTLNCHKLTMSIELKIRLDMTFARFKKILLKCAFNCWLENMKTKKDNYHYMVSNVTFHTQKTLDFNMNGGKAEKIDSMAIKDLFDFKSDIKCNIVLVTLEEMMMYELKTIKSEDKSDNVIRWNEFKEMQFSELSSSFNKKFEPEYKYIAKYIKRFVLRELNLLQQYTYMYTKDNSKQHINEGMDLLNEIDKSDEYDKRKVSIMKDNLSIIIYDNNDLQNKINKKSKIPDIHQENTLDAENEMNSSMSYNVFSNKNISSPEEELVFPKENQVFNMRKESGEDIANIQKHLAFKTIVTLRDTSKYYNLCVDFKHKFNKERFIDKIRDLYKISIERGILDMVSMPEFRNFGVSHDTIDLLNMSADEEDESNEELMKKSNISIIVFIALLIIFFTSITVLVFSEEY